MDIDDYWWDQRVAAETTRPVTLDDYEGPEDGNDDEPVDPRDEYDRNNASGYDLYNHWSY